MSINFIQRGNIEFLAAIAALKGLWVLKNSFTVSFERIFLKTFFLKVWIVLTIKSSHCTSLDKSQQLQKCLQKCQFNSAYMNLAYGYFNSTCKG